MKTKRIVKVFHPYYHISHYVKNAISKIDSTKYEIQIHSDGNFDIEAEKKILDNIDEVIFYFPFWWYQVPWNMKKYIDEVLEYKKFLLNLSFSFNVFIGQKIDHYDRYSVEELLKPTIITLEYLQANYLGTTTTYGCIPPRK